MKVTLVDSNDRGMQTMIDAIGVCRDKECSEQTIYKALEAKPVPHMSALEFGWVCIKVEGVSVKAARQLFRHRHFSFMEASSRSIALTDAKGVVPQTALSLCVMDNRMKQELSNYREAFDGGETLEDASYLLPMGTETTFYLAGNLRTWYEYFQKRLCKKHVQDEHYRLAKAMQWVIAHELPIMWKAHPCKDCGVCGE